MATRARKGAEGAAALEPIESWREGDRAKALEQRVAAALESSQLSPARIAFAEYRELVLAHLANEEDVSFPAAERRAPNQADPIRSLRVAHIGIRSDLEQVATHLALGHVEAARSVFAAFRLTFAAHERLEDQLVLLILAD